MTEVRQEVGERSAPACPFDHHRAMSLEEIHGAYATLRPGGPTYSSEHGGYWMVTRFEDVRGALRDPATFSSAGGHRIPAIGSGRSLPIDVDPPLHGDYRKLFTDRVTPQLVRAMTPFLRSLADELVGGFHAAGGGDFVHDVALAMPLAVLPELVGFSRETVVNLRVLTERSWEQVAEASLDEARGELRQVMRDEISRHRTNRPDDYLTELLSASIDGRLVTDDELERTLLTFAIAGHETTANAAAWLAYFLARDGELQEALRAEPALAGAYVEEGLRLGTPAQLFARQTTTATDIGQCPVPAGARVLLSLGAANRDERQYARPDEFNIARGARGHLAFGFGIHQCPGALLARTELRLLLEALASLPPWEPAGPAEFEGFMGGIHLGPRRLPLKFTDGSTGERTAGGAR
jgi:cytochrome P450